MMMAKVLDEDQVAQCKSILVLGKLTKELKPNRSSKESRITNVEKPIIVDLPKCKLKKMSANDFSIGEKVNLIIIPLCSTVLCCTLLCSAVLYSTLLCSALLYPCVLSSALVCSPLLLCALLLYMLALLLYCFFQSCLLPNFLLPSFAFFLCKSPCSLASLFHCLLY